MKQNYRDMKKEELEKTLEDLTEEQMQLRFRKVIGEINNPVRKRLVRRSIARCRTLLHEYTRGVKTDKE